MTLESDRDLVVSHLHHSGSRKDAISNADAWEVYCLADGFGLQPPEVLVGINGGWDWSHVRDSTPEGWTRMAEALRAMGYASEAPRP